MANENVSAPVAGILQQARGNLGDAVSSIEQLRGVIADALKPTAPPADLPRESERSTLQRVQLELAEVLGRLRGTRDLVQVLTPVGDADSTSADTPPDVLPLAGVSATTLHRMSEIQSALKLTDQQTLERCVATQTYVDDRLRDGWQFTINRGRERRAVTFPGQMAV